MFKFWMSIKKEYLQLINDKVGLLLMFLMPLFLVLIITIVQNSAYQIVNENKVSLLIVNKDKGAQSVRTIKLIEKSGMFDITIDNSVDSINIKRVLLKQDILTAIFLPNNFSEILEQRAKNISQEMLSDFGIAKDSSLNKKKQSSFQINFYHDPVLQDNYSISLINMLNSLISSVENSLMIESVYSELGIEQKTAKLRNIALSNKITINKIAASNNNSNLQPNSTQHNVPAWTIFAMFFMVISLGGNIVKERINGSFVRLKTMPTNFLLVLYSKMFVFLIVALLQVALIFSVGIFLFPYIHLPQLILPTNFLSFISIVLLSALAAVSYAIMIGSVAKTQEQANGFGAVSIIIFAAIGGIWVPIFVMPEYMQIISNFSPLQWSLKGFYILFLKGGNWNDLYTIILSLSGFIFINLSIIYYKLKLDKII